MAMVRDEQGKAQTIGDILGSQANTSFDRPISYVWQGDTSTVSLAGQTIDNGGNLIINIRDSGVCIHLLKTCLTFRLRIPSTACVNNILQMFALTSIQLGSIQWSFGGTQHLLDVLSAYMDDDMQDMYKKQLLIDPLSSSTPGTPQASIRLFNTRIGGFLESMKIDADTPRVNGVSPEFSTYCVSIPLGLLAYPLLDMFGSDNLLYLGESQVLSINLNLNAPEYLIFGMNGQDDQTRAQYRLTNCSLIKALVSLDPQRENLIKSSHLILPKSHIINVPQPFSSAQNVVFNCPMGSRLKQIRWAVYWQGPNIYSVADDDDDPQNLKYLYGNCINALNPRTYFRTSHMYRSYHPIMGIEILQLSVNGHQFTLNQTQIASLIFNNTLYCEQTPLHRNDQYRGYTQYVYTLDISRFAGADLYGSGIVDAQNTIQLQVQWSKSTRIYGEATIGPFQAADAIAQYDYIQLADSGLYQCEFYILMTKDCHLENGIYKE